MAAGGGWSSSTNGSWSGALATTADWMTSPPMTSSAGGRTDCVICDYQLSGGMKALRVLLGLAIVLANAVTVTALVRAPTLQTTLKVFLVNLSLADALMGACFAYLTLVVDIWTGFTLECAFRYGSLSYLQMVTLYSILVFSADQLTGLVRPLTSSTVGKRTLALTLTLLWLGPAVATAVSYEMRDGDVTECYFGRFTGTASFFIFATLNVVAVLLAVACQVSIFLLAKIQVNKIAPTMVGTSASDKRTQMNFRVAITSLVVVTPFLLLSTPLLGCYLHLAINPQARMSKEFLPVITMTLILTIVNCAVDPVVFCVRLRSVRLQLRKMVRGLSRGRLCQDLSDHEGITVNT